MSETVFDRPPSLEYSENAAEVNFAEFKKVVESRRSVRVFTADPLPDEVVNQAIDLALLAPNSSNLQCWEFYWVRTPEKREKLIDACFAQPAAKTSQALIVCVARIKTWKGIRTQMLNHFKAQPKPVPQALTGYYQKLVPLIYAQGFLSSLGFVKRIAFWLVGWFRPVPRGPFNRAGMETWAVKSSALACENLMLALRAQGFDSCPMEGFDEDRVRRLLKLPGDAVVTMVIGAGKRAPGGVYGPRIRFAREQFVKQV